MPKGTTSDHGELPPYLTPRQVAKLFQVRETTVRSWMRRGMLNGIKIGHSWRIPRDAFDDLSRSSARRTKKET